MCTGNTFEWLASCFYFVSTTFCPSLAFLIICSLLCKLKKIETKNPTKQHHNQWGTFSLGPYPVSGPKERKRKTKQHEQNNIIFVLFHIASKIFCLFCFVLQDILFNLSRFVRLPLRFASKVTVSPSKSFTKRNKLKKTFCSFCFVLLFVFCFVGFCWSWWWFWWLSSW